MAKKIRIVHYINQFFGQYGGEDAASMGIVVKEEMVGPGKGLAAALGDRAEIVATVICGDNHIAERLEEVTKEVVDIIEKYKPDLVFAGPAYGAGRYGVACGSVCAAVQKRLGIPAVTAQNEENPGADIFKKELYIIKTGTNARTMADDTKRIVALGLKLLAGEFIGSPEDEGYITRGLARNVKSPKSSAERIVDMLLDKYHGRPFKTEVPIPSHEAVPATPAIKDLANATVVLVTDGGLYPAGNPDRMPSQNADTFRSYSIEGKDELKKGDYIVCHNGYDPSFVLADPNRLVPVDAMRELVKDKVVGKMHEYYLATTGLITTIANSKKTAQAMAEYIKDHNIDAAILTST